MSYVSGVLVASKYLGQKYDSSTFSPDYVLPYYEHLLLISNTKLVRIIDRLYKEGRYWRTPIIAVLFEYRTFLKEIPDGKDYW